MEIEESTSLFDILSVSLVLRQLAPYLTAQSLLHLCASCKDLRELLTISPEAWRHMDLTSVRRATAVGMDPSPIDIGGTTWRAERMDEALTEDDFYAGPLRGIFSAFQRQTVLRHVQTLILDGLSVPADLVRDLVAEERYNVRVLSLREAKHLNPHKLNQVLRYIMRPTRAKGTPKLRALYIFGRRPTKLTAKAPETGRDQHYRHQSRIGGVMSSLGAQIGAELNHASIEADDSGRSDEESKWYGSTGHVLTRPLSEWPETLQMCKGTIYFDATLCRGPRHDITKVDSKDFLQPTIATIALGPTGCMSCGSCPEGPAIFRETDDSAFPLLGPAPLHSSNIRIAICPPLLEAAASNSTGIHAPLILRCVDCLRDRWCEQCNRWWCEDCYHVPQSRSLSTSILTSEAPTTTTTFGGSGLVDAAAHGCSQEVKVFSKLCVENCLVGEMMNGAGSYGMWG